MKKIAALIISLSLVFLVSCADKGEKANEFAGREYVGFAADGNVDCFAVSEDMSLYAVCTAEGTSVPMIEKFSPDGEMLCDVTITDYDANRSPYSAAVADNAADNAVFILSDKNNAPVIYKYSAESGELLSSFSPNGFASAKHIVSADENSLILCAVCTEDSALPASEKNRYRLVKINARSGSTELVSDALIADAAFGENGKIYALFSDGSGNSFAEFDTETLTMKSAPAYDKNTDGIMGFSVSEKGIIFYSPSASDNALSLCFSSFTNGGAAEIYPCCSVMKTSDITAKNGYTFLLNSYSSKLERLKNSVYIRDNKPVKIISSYSYLTSEFSCGYTLEMSEKTDEELSLAVLSNDSDFDAFYISSRQSICGNLVSNGVLYPLDDVPNVKEFADKCFPYIKDAMTDKDGNIVMIPIDISVPVFVCSGEKLSGADMERTDVKTLLNAFSPAEKEYYFNIDPYAEAAVNVYFRDNERFDTAEFRELAAGLKELSRLPSGSPDADSNYISGTNKDFLFSYNDVRLLQTSGFFIGSDKLEAYSLNYKEVQPSAFCTFISVNPSSKNLDAALGYVSELCGYLMRQENSFMLSGKEMYTGSAYADSLYDIYSNARVDITVPKSIYYSGMNAYFNGDISLDDFIREADRKLSAYLNE